NRLMEQAGRTRESVLDSGELLYLRSTANLSTGGTAVDVTDLVHPDNRDMAERAIKAVGLDVGGVDFLTPDITKSWQDIGGAICEVNAAPGFRMHVAPSEGTPRDVAGPVMDMLFPAGTPARIPIAAITGTNGKTTTSRMLAHILKTAGHTPGMTSSDGIYIVGRLTVRGDMTGPASARIVLRDPDVDVAVMETARGGLLRSGLGFLNADVSACLNIASDHLGMRGIDTLEQLAEIKRTVIEVATDTAVLNADDRLCLEMADYTEAENVCYVTMNSDHSLVRDHVRNGGRAVVLEKGISGDMITIYNAGQHIPLLWTHLIPATLEGKARHNVENAMFAAALAFSLDKSLDDIRHGLKTFDTTFFQAPGRLNVYDEHPFKVILDYAHNPSAVIRLCDVVRQLDVEGRRLCVLSAPGDRRDEDIREIAKAAAGVFDYYICRADDNRRGRGHDEVPRMLRETLIEAGVSGDSVTVVPDESEAVREILAVAGQGDLVMIFGDAVSRTWDQITTFDSSEQRDEAQTPVIVRQPTGARSEPETNGVSDFPDFVETESDRLIRDDRGVRLAREIND
ncbi:MAG: Mur ligase family protein, partial [Rhodothermia bacterium]